MSLFNSFTDIQSLRVYIFNLTAFLMTLTGVSEALKLVLLIASLVFTIIKTIDIVRQWKEKK
jgi:hypothetical protein